MSNPKTLVFMMNEQARAVKGIYADGATAELFKTLDQSIAVDDLVLVQSDARWKLSVIKITEVDVDIDIENETKILWVAERLDLSQHEQTLENEADAIKKVQSMEMRKKRKEMRKDFVADQDEEILSLALAGDTTLIEPPAAPDAS